MKVTYYVAASLDGFIAKEDGDVSWLDTLGVPMSETGYDDFYSGVDGVLMGRRTYEFIVEYGQWPYGDKPAWVCTSGEVVPMEGCRLQPARNPRDAYQEAADMGLKHIWCVGGGVLAASLVEDGLLTDVYLSVMPILLGGGVRLFSDLPSPVKLNKVNAALHNSGMFQLEYSVGENVDDG